MTVLRSVSAAGRGVEIGRHFTDGQTHPFDMFDWRHFDARVGDKFRQEGVEFPDSFSLNAVNIVSSKYFYGSMGDPGRENSLRQLVDRVVDTITRWGLEQGYFDERHGRVFSEELKFLLLDQRASFNSPVWFNVGIEGRNPQCSACFILSVEDTMESILNWYVEEGLIFKRGSGAGVNLSNIRSSFEKLSGGNEASGPVSFMRGADASAGVIKSGSTTRKAAKMVLLDIDHPDIEEFIWCKAREERKARALAEAGFDMGFDGIDSASVQYQNANNSVRIPDEFFEAYEEDGEWALTARTTGEVVKKVGARDLMRQIAKSAWECADPGVQYDTTIQRWHTCPAAGRITASNPCSEYLHLDNSACNLASINLRKYHDGQQFDVAGFKHTVEILITAMDILVGNSAYPTEAIAQNARRYRQLGLGFANLGGLLMSLGLPYDSEEGRAWAGAIAALECGQAYLTSVELARTRGPFDGYERDREGMIRVLEQHRQQVDEVSGYGIQGVLELREEARRVWDDAIEGTYRHGIRNAQAMVVAPTGTCGLMMDCDTLGIEPDLGLVKNKRLVGGGTMSIVNRTVPVALRRLGYAPHQADDIVSYIDGNHTIVGAPHLRMEHREVFACAMGDITIAPMGHVRMMAAVQPFISGAISKTVNVPEDATVEDIENIYLEGWRLGLKAIAVYRDASKVSQPLTTQREDEQESKVAPPHTRRKKLPKQRQGTTTSFRVGGAKGYLTVNDYEDGNPGEVFLKLGKQGTTLSGILDSLAISISLGLQYGVPLDAYVSKLQGMAFEPAGITNDPEIRLVSSVVDYVARWMAVTYMDPRARRDIGIYTTEERVDEPQATERKKDESAPLCLACGVTMRRNGACYVCEQCGESSGCS